MKTRTTATLAILCIPLRAAIVACGGGDDDGIGAELGGGGQVSTGTGGTTDPQGTGGSTATGTGGTAPDPPGTGLPQDAPLSGLTLAEATQLCRQQGLYLAAKMAPKSCMLKAASDGFRSTSDDPEAVCESEYQDCMGQRELDSDYCADRVPSMATCNATVGELKRCVVDWVALWDQLTPLLSCAAATGETDPALPTTTTDAEDPASCQELEARCPEMS
jgi:hypothetical protein